MQARRFYDFYDDFYHEFDYAPQPLFGDDLYDDEAELYAGNPYIYGASDYDDFDVEAADSVDVEDYLPSHQRAKLSPCSYEWLPRSQHSRKYTYRSNRDRNGKAYQREQAKALRPDWYRSA